MENLDFNNIRLQSKELLSLHEDEKIEVLKLAYRKGIDVWFETSRIFLEASVDDGGLQRETVESLFENLILFSKDIY